MPFVTQDHRKIIDLKIPGDRCYLKALPIWRAWKKEPRWTTIDDMWRPFFPDDENRAHFLALLVHFCLEGVEYERKKRAENGDII